MDYAQFPSLLVTVENGLATVKLNRPDTRNATTDMHRELEDVFVALAEDDRVNVAIVTGEGKAFSAGGNVKAMVDRHGTEAGWEFTKAAGYSAKRLVENILNCPKPTIAAINGDAMGLGATLALCCDIQIMAETARIGDTHVRVGLVAGDGGPLIWPLLIGSNRAKEYLMRGKIIDGVTAERINLVNYCVPQEEVMAKATEIASELNALPPLAVRWTKVSVNKVLKERFNLLMDASIAYEMLSMVSGDHKEALLALLEKRAPKFSAS